jgi:hypothetical protein
MQFGDKEHCAWMHAAQAPQQHYQVTGNTETGRYQVQHYSNCTRSLYTFESTHCTYAVALDAAADLATPECPLLAWGYVINGPEDASKLAAAARLQDEYAGCLAVGRRYEATGDVRVFA